MRFLKILGIKAVFVEIIFYLQIVVLAKKRRLERSMCRVTDSFMVGQCRNKIKLRKSFSLICPKWWQG